MTEAPGRKTDAHLSSVPGGEGRAAKIGEVFWNSVHQRLPLAVFFLNTCFLVRLPAHSLMQCGIHPALAACRREPAAASAQSTGTGLTLLIPQRCALANYLDHAAHSLVRHSASQV